MCPTMMAEPMAPGRGLPVYQPAADVVDGTCNAPFGCRPSLIRLVLTPISGMVSDTGLATGAGAADCGGATIWRGGAGRALTPAACGRVAGVEYRHRSTPAAPVTSAARPAAKLIAAGLRND